MSDEELYKIDVNTLLPQQPPFVMIDHLVHFDMERTTTLLTVDRDNVFVDDDGRLNPCAYAEIIAQTCASRLGYINKYIYHREVCVGVIGAIRNLCVKRSVHVGERLTTSISVREEVMNLMLVDATIAADDGETLCTAEMKIALATDTQATVQDTTNRTTT